MAAQIRNAKSPMQVSYSLKLLLVAYLQLLNNWMLKRQAGQTNKEKSQEMGEIEESIRIYFVCQPSICKRLAMLLSLRPVTPSLLNAMNQPEHKEKK